MGHINYAILEKSLSHLSQSDWPFLQKQYKEMQQIKPYKGLHIIHNSHITYNTIAKLLPLFASGAEITVTSSTELHINQEVLGLLKNANVRYVPYENLSGNFDVALDCCAGLLNHVEINHGAVELTQTGAIKYRQQYINYPVISVDDCELKKLETLFGTGDGFIRGFHQLTHASISGKKCIIFGFGKVGKGVVRALKQFNAQIIVIESNGEKLKEAQELGYIAIHFNSKNLILEQLKDTWLVVTTTGIKNIISTHFEADEIPAKYLVNMGSEDEWGEKFPTEKILNNKLAINFCLKRPTRTKFLDPIFYAHNLCIDLLLSRRKMNFYHGLPSEIDSQIIMEWLTYHYRDHFNNNNIDSILENIPVAVYWKDKESIYQGCNKKFSEAAGLNEPSDIIGKSDYDLPWSDEEKKTFKDGDNRVLQGEELLDFEEPLSNAKGEPLTVLANKIPYRDNENNIIGILGIYSDITERKRIENELRAANLAKESFIKDIEHDIRTPLAGISMISEYLEENEIDEQKKELLTDLRGSVKELIDYFNNVIEFSRTVSGDIPHLDKKFSLKKTIEHILEIEKITLRCKNLKLFKEFNHQYDVLIGDSYRLEKILLNLISNAVKFTENGHIKIITQEAKIDKDSVVLQIFIEDTGIGIPDELQQKIYEKFVKGSPSNQNKYKGFGLGLQIVKQLLSEMDGEIDLISKENNGSCFIITLPFKLPLLKEDKNIKNYVIN